MDNKTKTTKQKIVHVTDWKTTANSNVLSPDFMMK